LKEFGDIDSKFRFVILASKRAKLLLKGAKPKLKSKSKSLIRIAQEEVQEGLVDYEIIPPKEEEFHEAKDEVFIGEELEEKEEKKAKKKKVKAAKPDKDKSPKEKKEKKAKKITKKKSKKE